MGAILTGRAVLLLALRGGPGFGSDLARRVAALGLARLRPGTIYPALRGLEREDLATSWRVVPGGKRGARARIYYELTRAGVAAAEGQARALVSVVAAPARRLSAREQRLMRERIRSCDELSAFVLALRDRMREVAP